MKASQFACALAMVLLVAAFASAEPPKVIEAIPDNGETNVDPSLREIRVAFDQPMDTGGFSWVGGGPTYPKVLGRARWINDRTCVLPVQLEPNHEYWLSVNSQTFTNFQSKSGETAVVYPIAFKTAGKGTTRPVVTPAQNREAIERLKAAVDKQYSYRNLRNVNWEQILKEGSARLESTKTARDFAVEAGKLLAEFKDLHIWLNVDGESIPSAKRSVPPNMSPLNTLSKLVPGLARRSTSVYTGRFDDGIGYILITSWAADQNEAIAPAFAALREFADAKGLIVDVRPNAGGSETLAQQFAGCFVDEARPYGKHVVIEDGKFGPERVRVLEPNRDGFEYSCAMHPNIVRSEPGNCPICGMPLTKRKRDEKAYRGRIAVLMGKANMSSCESFLLMMKQARDCKLVGERSYGSSGNPRPHDLGNGVVVYLPCWKDMLLDGTCIEGEGIAPDVEVKAAPSVSQNRDPVLEAALKVLRSNAR